MADNQPSVQPKLTLIEKESKRIIANLNKTLLYGMVVGILGITGYSLQVEKIGWKLLYLLVLLAAASYVCGFFLGFLFGIPKYKETKEPDKEEKDSASGYSLNNNLVDISDWLTKIIIGLGLVEIRRIPGFLQSIGVYIQNNVKGEGEPSIKIFSVCCIVYFSVFGLYYGYNYMRLVLSGYFKIADHNLFKQLSEKADQLDKELGPVPAGKIDSYTMKNLAEYDQLLTSTKTTDNYTFTDWYYKGIKEYNDNNFTRAITYMENALEKDKKAKNASDAYMYIGLSYERLKLYSKGIETYNYAITQYPEYSDMYLLYNNKAVLLYKMENYAEALTEIEKSLNLNDKYDNAYTLKGAVLVKLGRRDEALEALHKAVALNSTRAITFYNLACIYALEKDKENMLVNLKKAVKLKKEDTKDAKTDLDFKAFWNDPDFLNLVS